MSEEILSVIVTDPCCLPDWDTAWRAIELAMELAPHDEPDVRAGWPVTLPGPRNGPAGYFRIVLRNPGRGPFTDAELNQFAAVLGRPVRQALDHSS